MENLDKVYAEQLAAEYAPKKGSKVLQLKKLDHKVKNPPRIFSYSFGIVGSLIFGTGMSLAMNVFEMSGTLPMILGIIIGLIGMVMISINYPIYAKWMKERKEKYAFEITELAKEISN